MPLTGAEFEQRSADEILEFLEAELRAEFGEDIDLTQSSAWRTFAEAISSVDADEIEPALQEVHNAAFLESASGENLDRLVAILGIERRSSVHSTGVVEFGHGETTKSDYTIRNGSVIQTDSNTPVTFETTELVEISLFDDFESGSLGPTYTDDTGLYDVVDGSATSDPDPAEGNGMLRGPDSSTGKIIDDRQAVSRGSTMDFRMQLQDLGTSNQTAAGNLFGVIDTSNFYRIRVDSTGTHAIERVTSAGTSTLDENTSVSIPTNEWLRNEVTWEGENDGHIVSRLYNSNDDLVDEIQVTNENEIDEGGFGFQSFDTNDHTFWDHSGEQAVQANARAREGGPSGNIGANSLVVMPSVPSGVQTVTNPWPMGDDDHRLTSTIQFTVGRDEETDEELRDRARISEGERGYGTVPALIAEISSLAGAESVSVYENKEATTVDGLPPKSFEVVYYGTDPTQTIADTLFDVKAFTARDFGGAHGTEVTETVEAENNQTFTMHWSEPAELYVDMTLDIVVNDQFIGEDDLRDRIVDYIGGTDTDGAEVLGTGAAEDVYVDQIEDVVTGPDDTGVIGIGSYSFTPSITTDSNGLEVVQVGDNEVALTNGQDGSITLNVTRV